MEETRRPQPLAMEETVEIVELDERLDMAFDPLSMFINNLRDVNTNCNHPSGCWPA